MIVVNHRVNTVEKLKNTPESCGVEIDLRTWEDKIILQHEPFSKGEFFDDFLKHYNHRLLILNVKSEGLEPSILESIKKFRVKDYFFLDTSFPFIIRYIKSGIKNIAVRFSEFESIETCLGLKGKVEWVFVDNFTRLPVENNSFDALKKYFKICIVSPELLNRKEEMQITKKIAERYDVDAVLTDNVREWL